MAHGGGGGHGATGFFQEDEILGKAYDARLTRRLVGYLGPYKALTILSLVLLLLLSIAQIAPPVIAKFIIDAAIAPAAAGTLPADEALARLGLFGAIYLFVLVAAALLRYGQSVLTAWIGQKAMYDLRLALFRHLQYLPLRFFDRNPVGRLMTRITNDIDALTDMVQRGVVAIFGDIFMLVGISIALLVLDWRLALVTFCSLPILVILTAYFRGIMRESFRAIRIRLARVNAYLNEHLSGMSIIQLFNRERRTLELFDDLNTDLLRLLDTEATIVDPPHPRELAHVRGEVRFDNVSFAYNEGDWVLRDVDFTIAAGESVAIVGATGAGKTSIISLISRFYDVQKGRILLDGVDIRELRQRDVRRHVGVVLQDPFIFAGTIASNIRLNNTAIGDEQVRAAARFVNADKFIERLPEGYETMVTERGSTLSVGQKQLLAFGRAIAFNPEILLVLDEATSSVDTETEHLIQDALAKLMLGRTSIIIAHRLSTIQNVDRIVVLHKGRVVEIGTHRDLLAQRGVYHRLYELQYRAHETPV